MPVIPVVGRKSFGMRMLIGAVYALLALGAVTMIYPFGLMLATATTGNADWEQFRMIPRYWTDMAEQFRKYIIDKNTLDVLAFDFEQEHWFTVRDVETRDFRDLMTRPARVCHAIDADYADFMAGIDPDLKQLHFVDYGDLQYSVLSLRPEYFRWLTAKYGQIDRLNVLYDDTAETWEDFGLPRGYNGAWEARPLSARNRDWREFVVTRPYAKQRLVSLDYLVFAALRADYNNVQVLNKTVGTSFKRLLDVRWTVLSKFEWGRDLQRKILRRDIPLAQIRLRTLARPAFETFGHRLFPGKRVAFTPNAPQDEEARGIWMHFVRSDDCKLEFIDPVDPAVLWRQFLEKRYGNVRDINTAHGTAYVAADQVRLPSTVIDWGAFRNNRVDIVKKFLLGNFQMVLNFVLLHGRALLNTLILILLTLCGTLTINPLAAYVLSRFRLRYAHHILVFLLATMAFPAEVIMIPGFLMVKQFPLGILILGGAAGLMFFLVRSLLGIRLPLFWSVLVGGILSLAAGWYLPPVAARMMGRPDLNVSLMNTFWALVLPGLASGYSIFLLKGFFDSLPPELYEAAMLDGASETRMFLMITLPLCKPVLAVIALGAFTAAYGSFMFAFLTCQDPKMWTLMVFLYQFQQQYSVPLVMASLVVAAVPTLLVFIFAQNIILRGIVIPTFK
ncbi:MAG: carbohydrate ABC transporter permease [Phycisphaerae bacterium]